MRVAVGGCRASNELVSPGAATKYGTRTPEVGSSDPRNTLNFRELRGSCCQMS